ncbi:MAG: hypothetical protein ACXWNQ_08930 [Anaerolineales bacterium]
MTANLDIGLLTDQSSELRGFSQFWLRYVRGFSPHFHCQKSLRGFNDVRVAKTMRMNVSFRLREPEGYDYIYLCGVTARAHPGLHLALIPEAGARARVVTYTGIEITVTGARQLEIPPLPDGFAGMSRKYTTCCNWQFGVKYYGLDGLRRELVRE